LKRRLRASCDVEETVKRKTYDHGGNRKLILQCSNALVTIWTATVINKKINKYISNKCFPQKWWWCIAAVELLKVRRFKETEFVSLLTRDYDKSMHLCD
jgi:hypothetical protein